MTIMPSHYGYDSVEICLTPKSPSNISNGLNESSTLERKTSVTVMATIVTMPLFHHDHDNKGAMTLKPSHYGYDIVQTCLSLESPSNISNC